MEYYDRKYITLENPEDEEEVEIIINYKGHHYPGRNYMSNGDPGYPDDSGMEYIDWEMRHYKQSKPEWITEELVQAQFDNPKNW